MLHDPREVHLQDVRQLTFGGENAEAYWSPDGKELIFQSTQEPYSCDQIFRLDPQKPGERQLVSTGTGRTTCAYFTYPEGERVIYATTHLYEKACPPVPDFSQGYVWPLYDSFELVTSDLQGGDIQRLTENRHYDAEATVCPLDGSIIFTSDRDGDLDLYRMDADGSNLRRLTDTPGYDGGAFFSQDCSQIVWRASRPAEGAELEDYQRLLKQNMVRPSRLEIWVAKSDGSEARQVTYLRSAAFAPYFYPDGKRIIFSTNYPDPRGREFDLWAVNVDGTDLERITFAPGFDGFPMFSPDGQWLAFASNRNQGKPGETDVYLARWADKEASAEARPAQAQAADRVAADARWLADDARQGRGLGTPGLAEAGDYLARRFEQLGLEPGVGDSYFAPFTAPVEVSIGESTSLRLDGQAIDAASYRPTAFSDSGLAEGEVVPVGYGISAPELEHDDYEGLDVQGKIVLVRRFLPSGETFAGEDAKRRYSDLRYKAWNAREHGAAGVLLVDLPVLAEGAELPEEAKLPTLRVDRQGDAGLPVVVLSRELGAGLLDGSGHRARLEVELVLRTEAARNVVARVRGGAGTPSEAVVVVGAHYDHLGQGGAGSLTPDLRETHNGADDNASGTAALLEIGHQLVERRDSLAADVYLVAFSGEESGLLGSTALTRNPPPDLQLDRIRAMINLDMVGRLRDNELSVLGSESAAEWDALVPPLCARVGLRCSLGGSGYGPSDQTPFYAAGAPVLHLFTGTHVDYHKPSDDAHKLNAAGMAQIAGLASEVVMAVAAGDGLTYRKSEAPPSRGDARSYGASLGTIPDYAGSEEPGVLLADTRPGGPAHEAGMRRGDLLVELAGREVRDIHDMMFVLRQSKPGQAATAVVVREGQRVELPIIFGQSRGMR